MQMPKGIETILENRQEEYGDAHTNFSAIGRGWGAMLGIEDIEPHLVALMMDFVKTIRLVANPKHSDSWADKHGYTQHGQEIAEKP